MNKLEFLTKELVDKAAKKIDKDGVPKGRDGKDYHVHIENKFYPFKLIITEAAKLEGRKLFPKDFGSSQHLRKYFEELTGYKCLPINRENDNIEIETFKKIVSELQTALQKEKSILKDFQLKIKNDERYVWVIDHKNTIGTQKAHYEIIRRHKKIFVELHFEGSDESNEFFFKRLDPLKEGLEWFKWNSGAKSIRVSGDIKIDSKNVLEELKEKLLFLEESIGDKVRELIKNNDLTKEPSEEGTKSKYSGPLNQILYGPPGTGKTYNTINEAIKIINPKFNLQQDRNIIKEEYDRLVISGQIIFTTFHQSMSYEDFIEGIKPQKPKNDGDPISYIVEDGIFKKICKEASKKTKIIQKIDEDENELTPEMFKEYYSSFVEKLPSQNENSSEYKLKTIKGNIFELYKNSANSIVVKAGDKKTPMSLSLNELTKVKFEKMSPFYRSYEYIVIDKILENIKTEEKQIDNSKKPYVLIIDEINRGNVSSIFGELITLIEEDKRAGKDETLKVMLPYSKKAFSVPSNLYIIGTMNTADRSVEALDTALRRRFSFVEMPPDYSLLENKKVEKFDLEELLKTINNRIEVLLDRDHLIGHSYFLNVDSIGKLKDVFSKNIIPLLQEYFYGDYGKIALVIGMEFFEKVEQVKPDKLFAKVDNYEIDVYNDKTIYRIKNISDSGFDIKNAINALLKETEPSNKEGAESEQQNG